ncbi:amino acid adenylation domain-containing protein [Plectosphaerella plurivora]|uniref:Amino acid adenylation domain-containing protein n=1 Tax=Plectosphaerella plurivora TaxID=936078 RepID=A0A9P9A8Z2_9PEZI|nr:amino acid adenylation domain-containing protein [Plectosphaerella plurivora]
MLSSEEGTSLSILNHPSTKLPGPCLLHDLVRQESVKDLPAIDGLLSDGSRWALSYAELHAAADRLAVQILAASQSRASKRDFIVPLLIPQCPQLYIAQLAVLKAGGAFCPLQLDAPQERIKFILEDVRADVLLVAPGLEGKIPTSASQLSVLTVPDRATITASGPNSVVPAVSISCDDLAYIMYTSGSTGTPKGVAISHGAATQSLLAHDQLIPDFQRFLQFAAPTFDVSVFEIFFPLFRGRTLVTCDRRFLLDDLPAAMNTMGVDACELTPTVAGSLLRSRDSVPTLTLLLTIGEMLTDKVVEEFGGNATTPSMLWGMYGPTEAAIHCTLQPAFAAGSSRNIIGVPLDSVSCFVARIPENSDPYVFEPLPLGDEGELVVGGFQLAREYLNRETQTAEAFIDTPFGRLYRTGDRARVRSDGLLECLGRISDGQVKLRGQRIELGEIEQAISRDPACQGTAVQVIQGVLVAFCTCDATIETRTFSDSIFQTCRQWLPEFMVPGDVVRMDQFPHLPSGKVDKHRLVRDYLDARNSSNIDGEASNPLASKLVEVFADILSTPVSPNHTLASFGLDSLNAIRAASRLRSIGITVAAYDIIEARSINALCAVISAAESAPQTSPTAIDFVDPSDVSVTSLLQDIPQATELDLVGAHACTALQSSMLFETLINPGVYFNSVELQFPTDCSAERARDAILRLAQDNEILRSGFVSHEAGFARIVHRDLSDHHITIVSQSSLEFPVELESDILRPFQVRVRESSGADGPKAMLRLHHALYDGWSIDLMTEDLSQIVSGQQPNSRPSFEVVSSFYESVVPPSLNDTRAYWAEHLVDWNPPSLPRFLGRPIATLTSAVHSLKLTTSLAQASHTSQQLGCHPQTIFQAALIWLWGRFLGVEDVVIGSIASGRMIPVDHIDQVMGPCITPAPLRVDTSTLVTGAHLIQSIHSTNRKALQHALLPLSEIRKAAVVKTGQSLYDALLVYQETLYSQQRLSRPVREVSHRDSLETALLVEIEPVSDGLICQLTYHTDLFSEEAASLFAQQLDAVAHHLTTDPSAALSQISQHLPTHTTSISNSPPSSFEGEPDLGTWFENIAAAHADHPALCFANSIIGLDADAEVISFQELNRTANQLAWCLRAQGIEEGAYVAVIMEKSPRMYAAILAVVKAGCAYLPLLPSTPAERIRTIMDQASVQVCLADHRYAEQGDHSPTCTVIDVEAMDFSGFPDHNLPRTMDGSRAAYIIYTSGTTGVPKGIVVTQLNITSNLQALSRLYPIDDSPRLLQLCSQAFDVSVFEIFFTWVVGGCLCSGTNDVLFENIERSIQVLRCTHLSLTPTVAALILPQNVPTVRFLVTAGEPMTDTVARNWGDKLFQGYGPAETTNICTVKKMRHGDQVNHLGFPLSNTSCFVISQGSDQIVPIGGYGEFCFGGDQIAQGYLALPEVTDAKFISHPIHGRLYRSGDMGRMLADRSLLISGRLDGQVKLRGQRIETLELETIITSLDKVVSAVSVIAQSSEGRIDQLVCFYVPTDRASPSFELLPFEPDLSALNTMLFGLLRAKVPSYMVPTLLIPITCIPLTSSGKTDKRRLRSQVESLGLEYLQSAAASELSSADSDEWTPAEMQVAEAASQALDISKDKFHRWTPMTAMGLDSISAIKFCRCLESFVGARVAISLVLQDPCVARIAQLVDTLDHSSGGANLADLPSFDDDWVKEITTGFVERGAIVESVLPCTPLQQAMLAAVNVTSYANRVTFRLNIATPVVKQAWAAMVQKHGILRTCFFTSNDAAQPIAQVILQYHLIPWTESRETSLQEATSRLSGNLPLAVDSYTPPYRLDVFEVDSERFLVFSCHHALYDGQSMRIMLEDVEAVVQGTTLHEPVAYAPFLQHALSLPATAESFWQDTFQDFVAPLSQLDAADSDDEPEVFTETSSTSLSAIQLCAQASGGSLLSVCQAAWAITLRLLTGESDICFGNVVSGRTVPIPGVERLAAPCFNTIPLRAQFQDDRRFVDLFQELRKLNAKALDYQFTPLKLVQKTLGTTRSLFDTILLLQPVQRQVDPAIWEMVEDHGDMDVPLVCELTPDASEDIISVTLHVKSKQIPNVAVVAELLSHILGQACKYPRASIPSLADLPSELRARLGPLLLSLKPRPNLTPAHAEVTADEESQAAWSSTEAVIRSVLSQLSRIPQDRINRETTIFQLGLDSINAVQVAKLLRRQELPVSALDVISSPSCAALAQKLAAQQADTSSPEYDIHGFKDQVSLNIESHTHIDNVLPCTPVQCGMLSDFVHSGGQDYFNFMSFALDESVQMELMQQAWERLAQHHPILRTGFAAVDHPDSSFAMLRYKVTPTVRVQLNPSNQPFDVSQWRAERSQQAATDLSCPPWNVCLDSSTKPSQMHLAIHHALYDAESIQILLEDLHSLLKGQEPPPAFPIDETVSSIIQASKEDFYSKRFWTEKAQAVVVNRFPTLTPLIEPTSNLAVHTKVSQLDTATLQAGAVRSGASVQSIIQTAWARLLAAYLGEADVVFGVVLSGRVSEASEKAMIPVISTLPVIANTAISDKELLEYMLEYNTKLAAHQNTPLSKVQRWLEHPQGRLFDSLLVYQKSRQHGSQSPPWRVIHDEGKLDFTVSLEVEPREDQTVQLRLSFQTGVIPPQQAMVLVDQFDSILQQLAGASHLDERPPWETRSELFSITPPVEPVIPSEESLLHEFVERAALRWHSRTAIEFVSRFNGDVPESQTWSFSQLDELGNRVARGISQYGRQGQIVAVHFDKSPEALFSILGILKAGFCFLALDPSAPTDRKEFILQDSGAVVLLTSDAALDFHAGCPVVQVTQAFLNSLDNGPFMADRPIDPSDPCYCLYTSGTTGTPKGCEISHDNAVQAMKAFQRLFDGHWDDQSRWLQFASFHFDVTVLEQYWSWSVGMPLVAAPRDIILDDIAAAIRRLHITHIDLTPSLARLLDPADVPSLSRGVFITGGEALKQEILDVWGPQGVIYNAYGPTEATIGVTMYQRVPKNGRASNIGRQFDNVGSFVLQPGTDIPVLKGAVGELCVSGKLVGKGYLNRPELTEERFPMLASFGERVYRTGDLVRLLHDGCFEFLGRADDQVKLRGQRLEIGEINHVIRTGVAGLRDVVTLVAKHPTMDKDLLVSFVTSNKAAKSKGDPIIIYGAGADQHRKAVQRVCREKLPGYMMPTFIFEVSFIPLSINNKADLKSLKRVFHNLGPGQLLQLSSNHVDKSTPLTDLQRRAVDIAKRFGNADTEDISISTNLFDMGLDSISSLQLARLFKEGGISGVTPSLILRNPVLSDLLDALGADQPIFEAGKIRENQQSIQAFGHRFRSQILQNTPLLSASDIEYVAPCTPLQEGMLSNALVTGEEAYFVRFRLRLSSNISVDRLRESWASLIKEHAILRTQFFQTSGGFAQVAAQTTKVPWRETCCSDANLDDHLDQLFRSWKHKNREALINPLDLALVTTSSGLFLAIHIFHAIYDGVSLDLMLDWVNQEYWQHQHRPSPRFFDAMPHGPARNFESTRSFWKAHLEGCSFEPLPAKDDLPGNQYHILSEQFASDKLVTVQRSSKVTQQTLVLSLWAAVFAKHFSKQAAFGVVYSGRSVDLLNADRIIGPLFNTLPFFANAGKHPSWPALIQHAHDFNTTTLEFQHVPLRNIQKWCAPGRAIIDSLFVFQNETISTPGVRAAPWEFEQVLAGSEYPLAFEVTATVDGHLEVRIVARSDVASPQLCHQLMTDFGDAIQSLSGQRVSNDIWSVTTSEMTSLALTPRTRGSSGSASHGHSTGHSTPDLTASAFEWTAEISALRHEVATLAGVPEEKIHATTTLLELGLDSIDLVTLSSRMKARGCHVTLPKLMKARNIGEAGRVIETTSPANDNAEDAEFEATKVHLWQAIKRGGWDMKQIESVLPPTPSQESMMADMLESGFDRYFNHATFEISPGTDIPRFIEAWSQVVNQSSILRTVFRQIVDFDIPYTFCQVVLKDGMPRVDSRRLDRLEDISSVTSDHKQRAMIANGASGLFQISIVYINQASYLVLSLAHALYDGWSLALLHQDVLSAYHGTLQKRPATENTLRTLLKSSDDQSRIFWSEYLNGAPASLLVETPTLTPMADTFEEGTSSLSFDKVLDFCKSHSISLQVLAQACWATVLASRVGSLDVTFGVVLSGRETEEAQALLFPTMNTVAVRCVLHGSRASFLQYLQESMANIYQHQAFPLRVSQTTTTEASGRLFNTLFLLQKQPISSSSKKERLLTPVSSKASTGFAVCVELEAEEGLLKWSVASKADSYNNTEVHGIILSLDQVLQSLVENSHLRLIDFNNDLISFCGLPSFRLPEEPRLEAHPITFEATQDDDLKPWTPVENSIREVLSLVSGVPTETILKTSTPYQLGLDSISLIKVSSLLRERDLHLGVKALLTVPSIAELAGLASSNGDRTPRRQDVTDCTVSPRVNIESVLQRAGLSSFDVEDVLPALPMQVFTMSTWQRSEGDVFCPTFYYSLGEPATFDMLSEAWRTLVRLEPILRTCLVPTADRETPFVQLILKSHVDGPHQQVFDSSHIQGADPTTTWPPVRLSAKSTDGGSWELALQLHHCLYDAFSLSSLISRFERILSGTEFDGSATSISGWKSFLGQYQSPEAVATRKTFWTQYLHDVVPAATSTTTEDKKLLRTAYLDTSAISNMSSIKSFCSNHRLGVAAVLLAAVAQCWHQERGETAQSPLVLGVYLANRGESLSSNMQTFPTLNMLPCKIYVGPESGLLDLAFSIQQDLLNITDPVNATAKLWEIKDWTGVTVDTFVNVLNLPSTLESTSIIEQIEGHDNGTQLPQPQPIAEWKLVNAVKDVYPEAIDIEAGFRGDGLAIGLFGSEARVSHVAARDIVARVADNIRQALA